MKQKSFPDLAEAEVIALKALAFLAEEPERFGRFLALTGTDLAQIPEAARSPGFLSGVLDHVRGDQSLLFIFAESAGLKPEDIDKAAARLEGQAP